jgi:DNA-binding response OmpR family regulator
MKSNIKILIVDDDPDLLFATARIINAAGYRVFTAATGAQCMERVKSIRPDLMLLDVMLPDADGQALCSQIKADPALKNIFVVLISGTKTDSAEQAYGLDLGADGYIARPIANRELLARVGAMVRILQAERERDRLIAQLEEALARVKTLSGLLPICAGCKKIRDDKPSGCKKIAIC